MKSRLIGLVASALISACDVNVNRPNEVSLSLQEQEIYTYTLNAVPLGFGRVGFYGEFHNPLDARLNLTPVITYKDGDNMFLIKGEFFLKFDKTKGPQESIPEVPERGNVYWAAKTRLDRGLGGFRVDFNSGDITHIVPSIEDFFNEK